MRCSGGTKLWGGTVSVGPPLLLGAGGWGLRTPGAGGEAMLLQLAGGTAPGAGTAAAPLTPLVSSNHARSWQGGGLRRCFCLGEIRFWRWWSLLLFFFFLVCFVTLLWFVGVFGLGLLVCFLF